MKCNYFFIIKIDLKLNKNRFNVYIVDLKSNEMQQQLNNSLSR